MGLQLQTEQKDAEIANLKVHRMRHEKLRSGMLLGGFLPKNLVFYFIAIFLDLKRVSKEIVSIKKSNDALKKIVKMLTTNSLQVFLSI